MFMFMLPHLCKSELRQNEITPTLVGRGRREEKGGEREEEKGERRGGRREEGGNRSGCVG